MAVIAPSPSSGRPAVRGLLAQRPHSCDTLPMRCIGLNSLRLVVLLLLGACGDSTPTDTAGGSTSGSTAPDPDSSGSLSATLTSPDSSSGGTTTDTTGTDDAADSTDTGGTADSTGHASSSSSESSSSSSDPGESSSGGGALADITGDHLLALATVIAPDTPLQYLATVVQTPDGDGALLDISLQPLSLDVGSTTTPRLPFGAPLVFDDIEVAADGSFEITVGGLEVTGETNPITGSDALAANVVLTGTIVDDASWCGTAAGALTAPLRLDLAGTTFAATAVDGDLPLGFSGSC